jgi:hypothetical protein
MSHALPMMLAPLMTGPYRPTDARCGRAEPW